MAVRVSCIARFLVKALLIFLAVDAAFRIIFPRSSFQILRNRTLP